jgi:hypothetical protein
VVVVNKLSVGAYCVVNTSVYFFVFVGEYLRIVHYHLGCLEDFSQDTELARWCSLRDDTKTKYASLSQVVIRLAQAFNHLKHFSSCLTNYESEQLISSKLQTIHKQAESSQNFIGLRFLDVKKLLGV